MTSKVPGIDEPETSLHVWIRPDQFQELRKVAYNETVQARPDIDSEATGWNHLSLRDELIVQVFYDTGIRVGELVGLNMDDLRLQHETPHIFLRPEVQRQVSQGRPRQAARMSFDFVDTAQKLRIWKESRWKDTEAVFPSQMSNRITEERVWQITQELAKEAGIRPYIEDGTRGEPTDMHPHAFRHSVAYRYLVEQNRGIEDVKQRLRHRSLKVTERFYEHFLMR